MWLADFWRRWEGRLYYWYYHVLPWPSPARKRRLILVFHRHLPWLTRQTASYRMLPHARHEDLRGIDLETAHEQMHDYAAWRAAYVLLSRRKQRHLRRNGERLRPLPRLGVLIVPSSTQAPVTTRNAVPPQEYPTLRWLTDTESWPGTEAVEYVMVLRAGTRLHAGALWLVVEAIRQHPEAELLYADEEWSEPGLDHHAPWFKPDWDPDLMLGCNLVGAVAVYRRAVLTECRFDAESAAPEYALALQVSERFTARQITHIPRVLADCAPERLSRAERIQLVESALRRRAVDAVVEPSPLLADGVRVRYALPWPAPSVSLIIPTRNALTLLRRCLDTLIARTDYPDYEILIVDNGSDEADALAFLSAPGAHYPDAPIRVLRDERPFNYSRLNNQAVEQACGEVIGLLNNDLEIIDGGWLAEMVSQACRPDIGAVGARLLYPDGRLQHVGVIVGLGGAAGHVLRNNAADQPDRFGPPGWGRSRFAQGFSAVTAACLVVRKTLYQAVGGLDETTFPVTYNDVDFCLKLRRLGYRNLYTPFATLYHHESASRGSDDDDPVKAARAARELASLQQRWGTWDYRDPAYNPNFNRFGEDCGYSYPPQP